MLTGSRSQEVLYLLAVGVKRHYTYWQWVSRVLYLLAVGIKRYHTNWQRVAVVIKRYHTNWQWVGVKRYYTY